MKVITKSVQKKTLKSDGIRICIMRRIKPEFEFDMWLPALSPSTRLLADYQNGEISWKLFEKRLKKELLPKKKQYIEMIIGLSKRNNVTLLCWEDSAELCHRSIITQEIKKLSPNTAVLHK